MSAEPVWIAVDPGDPRLEWEALCRVQCGVLRATPGGAYLAEGGGPGWRSSQVTGGLARTLGGLLAAGHAVLGLPGEDGFRALATTVAGEIRYAELLDGWLRHAPEWSR